MNMKKEKFLIMVMALFLSITIYVIETKSVSKEQQNVNIDEILNEIENENVTSTLVQKKYIADKFYNLVFKKENAYQSYFVNAKTGKKAELNEFLIEGKEEEFKDKVNSLIELKYPKFIADKLKSKEGNVAFQLNDDHLVIYFSNFIITPEPKEELKLKVDYNEIKDFLNFEVKLNSEYENENGYHFDSSKKTIALTFDDGPNGEKTKKLVDLFAQNKMHATFFMVGNRMANNPGIIQYVLEHQNEVGSHSYSHSNMTRLKKEKLIEDEQNTNAIYKKITGQDLKILRPPYGNINSLMKETLNYVFVNWNVDTEDWRYRNKEHVKNAVISKVKDGDIILMHDLYDSTIEAVEEMLPELYVEGFQVVTITELANLKGQNLNLKKVYRSIK